MYLLATAPCVLLSLGLNLVLVRANPIVQRQRTSQQCGQDGHILILETMVDRCSTRSAGLGEPLNTQNLPVQWNAGPNPRGVDGPFQQSLFVELRLYLGGSGPQRHLLWGGGAEASSSQNPNNNIFT
ncbi:hypothetical protein GGU11DRAFT_752610 [Lentinula aff. detonsa]|nr:hypothetical protein GGU11DRAFT_752610 [Lentinula aff. detonsa]